ncbi:MAG: hypothetical protein Fur0035_06970 [Anaerolineales bacterium]
MPLILELGISFFLGNNLTANYLQFSQTVTQGDYSEGWSLPWEYFWHAEGGLLVILLVLVLIALISTPQLNDRLRLYLTGLLFIYICLVIPSVVTHSFVVYGRLARQMMPFLVLIAAFGLQQMFFFSHYGRYFFSISVGLCVVFAGFRYADAFQQIYPLEFAEEAQIRYAQFRISNAAIDFRSPTLCMKGNYIAANVKYIYPSPETLPDIQGDLLMSDPHPMNFIPYLYEGYTPQQRQNFLDKRVMMYLYTIKPGSLPKTEVPILSCVP